VIVVLAFGILRVGMRVYNSGSVWYEMGRPGYCFVLCCVVDDKKSEQKNKRAVEAKNERAQGAMRCK